MKHIILLIFTLTGVMSCSIKVCLRWTRESNTLKLACRIDDLHFFMIFKNNYGKEIARCNIPNPVPECHDTYPNTTSTQYPEKNETIVIINGTIDQRINGNWSCHHGAYNDFVEIKVKQHERPDPSGQMKIPLWVIIIIIVVFLIVISTFLVVKCTEKYEFCSVSKNVTNVKTVCAEKTLPTSTNKPTRTRNEKTTTQDDNGPLSPSIDVHI